MEKNVDDTLYIIMPAYNEEMSSRNLINYIKWLGGIDNEKVRK